MSFPRPASHRRRSRSTSASSTPAPSRFPDLTWRLSSKGAHSNSHSPLSTHSDLSTPQKWDVDAWRRGKRARREHSPSFSGADIYSISRTMPPSGARLDALSTTSAPPTPIFAATSAEFHIFPAKKRSRIDDQYPSFDSNYASSDDMNTTSSADLTRLRSEALWELQQSVLESGEGLVRRMRDYEDIRSRSDLYSKAKEARRRGRKRASLISRHRKAAEMEDVSEDEDEDDVQIFAGDLSSALNFGSTHKRTMSLCAENQASYRQQSISGSSQHWSSPGATRDSSPSAYPSDDENPMISHLATTSSPYTSSLSKGDTPMLSHSATNSVNSSIVSLPLPSPVHREANTSATSTPRPHILPASRSEKAIAALSLAMANGAGGLNDYEALRSIQAPTLLETSHVGELWH